MAHLNLFGNRISLNNELTVMGDVKCYITDHQQADKTRLLFFSSFERYAAIENR